MVMSKDKEGKPPFPRFWLFVLFILGALVLGDLNQRMADVRQMENDAALLEAELERLEAENASLEDEIAIANTAEYVEQWAHHDAKMVRQGEVLVILVGPEGEEDVSKLTPDTDTSELSNFEVWLKLLFGK